MIRIDPSKWTADFRISRALAEAYTSSGLNDVVFFCVGRPDDLIGRLGPTVGDETIKYYPNVLGTADDPVTSRNFQEKVAELADRFPDCFVIGVEAGYGRSAHLGSIEMTDRALTSIDGAGYINDVTINVVLRLTEGDGPIRRNGRSGRTDLTEAMLEVGSDDVAAGGRRSKFRPLHQDDIDSFKIQQLADKVIDGHLRFLSRINKQVL